MRLRLDWKVRRIGLVGHDWGEEGVFWERRIVGMTA